MNNTDSFTDGKYYELFINNGSNYSIYWMSSRCVNVSSDFTIFNVYYINSGSVDAYYLCESKNVEPSNIFALRPVITLNSNIQVTSGNGSLESPFNIQ